MMRAHRPLHEHLAPPAVQDESEHTREVVAGELAQWMQICSEIAGKRYSELVEAGDPDAAEEAARVAHELAGKIRIRVRQWSRDQHDQQ